MFGSRSDPFDGHVPQPFANGVQKDQHHVVQQRMALHEKIDIVGLYAELTDVTSEGGHFVDPGRVVGFQRPEAFVDLAAEPVQRFGAVVAQIQVVEPDAAAEVEQRKGFFAFAACRVGVP